MNWRCQRYRVGWGWLGVAHWSSIKYVSQDERGLRARLIKGRSGPIVQYHSRGLWRMHSIHSADFRHGIGWARLGLAEWQAEVGSSLIRS